MRTISIRLDDRTDTALRSFCERHGLSQTDALKAAIEQLAERHRPSPAELAEQLGLIGAFRSGAGDLAAGHSQWVKHKLRAKQKANTLVKRPAAGKAARRNAKAA